MAAAVSACACSFLPGGLDLTKICSPQGTGTKSSQASVANPGRAEPPGASEKNQAPYISKVLWRVLWSWARLVGKQKQSDLTKVIE